MLPVSLELECGVTGLELDTLGAYSLGTRGSAWCSYDRSRLWWVSIALVNKDKVEAFEEAVGKRYEEIVGYAPSFYIAEVAAGTRVLD